MRKVMLLVLVSFGFLAAKTVHTKLGLGIGNTGESWKGAAVLYLPVADYWSIDVKGIYGIQKGEVKFTSGGVSQKTTTNYSLMGIEASFVGNIASGKDAVIFAGPSLAFGKTKATTEVEGVETEVEQSYMGIGGTIGFTMSILKGWDFYGSVSSYGLSISYEEEVAEGKYEYKTPDFYTGVTIGIVKVFK